MKKVSILVTLYNTKQYLPKLIQSIKNQSYPWIELVFVDDGSDDDSIEFLKQEFKFYPNVKYLKNETNKGTLYSRCKGFLACTGEYMVCIDSDDYVNTEYIKELVDFAENNNCDIVFPNHLSSKYNNGEYLEVENKLPTGTRFWENNILETFFTIRERIQHFCAGKLIKTDIIQNVANDIKNTNQDLLNITMGEDIVHTMASYYYCNKVGLCEAAKYFYVSTGNQTTTVKDKQSLFKKLNSIFKSIKILKEILISKNILHENKQNLYKLVKKWEGYYFTQLTKYQCFDECFDLEKQYDIC